MVQYFLNFNPIIQAFIAGMFTFFITSLGASVVFFFKKTYKLMMDIMLAFSAGIMLAASFFSLLNPAIEIADSLNMCSWFVVLIGFLSGVFLLEFGNSFISFHASSAKNSIRRSILLFISITLHNIPEGLVLGVAFGSIPYSENSTSILSAIILTIGIAIQNFPEGSAISLPMRRDNISRWKAFLFGVLSAIVEPIAAIIGALLVIKVQLLLPFVLSFAAGAMIFVIIIELIPESQSNQKKGLIAFFDILGFSLMMILELLLG